MQPTSRSFKENAHQALANANLQKALEMMRSGFPGRRAASIARLPEFDALREQGKAIKDHVLEHLDLYLETFEKNGKLRVLNQRIPSWSAYECRLEYVNLNNGQRWTRFLMYGGIERSNL